MYETSSILDDGYSTTNYSLVIATDHGLFTNFLVNISGPTNVSDIRSYLQQQLNPLRQKYNLSSKLFNQHVNVNIITSTALKKDVHVLTGT